MKKNVPAILITLLALFLRTYMAYSSPIEPDEEGYVTAAYQFNTAFRQGDITPILDSTFNIEHPQLFKLIYAAGLMIGPPIEDVQDMQPDHTIQYLMFWHRLFLLRMISVLLGTAVVYLVSRMSPLAGLFLAVDTFAVKYTGVVYLEALPMLTSLVAVLAAIQAQKNYQRTPKEWKIWAGWLGLSSLALGMTAASKYIYCLVGIAIVLIVLIQGRRQILPTLAGLTLWGLFALFFFYLCDPILWESPITALRDSIQFSINYSKSQAVQTVGYPFWQPIKWLMISIPQQPTTPCVAFFIRSGDFFIAADSVIFALAVVGLPVMFKKNRPMFIWLVSVLFFLLIWSTKWPQYIVPLLVPQCFSAAYGNGWLKEWVTHKASSAWPITQAEKAGK